MIKVFQIAVDGVGTDSFYEARTAEEALEEFEKDCIEEGDDPEELLIMTAFNHVKAILCDEYED